MTPTRFHQVVAMVFCLNEVISSSRVWIRLPILLVVVSYSYSLAQQGKFIFLCPRSRLRIRFRETGSAVPSHVSLLISHTLAESCAYSRDPSRFPRRRPFLCTASRHRASLEFIRSRICVPMTFTAPRVRPRRARKKSR